MQPAPLAPTRADALFHALGDPTRRRMVSLLAGRPASVSGLADALGISKTAVGQHLAVLEGAALARSAKAGRVRTCRFEPAGLAALQDWVDWHRSHWDQALDRLGDVLAEDAPPAD